MGISVLKYYARWHYVLRMCVCVYINVYANRGVEMIIIFLVSKLRDFEFSSREKESR